MNDVMVLHGQSGSVSTLEVMLAKDNLVNEFAKFATQLLDITVCNKFFWIQTTYLLPIESRTCGPRRMQCNIP